MLHEKIEVILSPSMPSDENGTDAGLVVENTGI